MFDLSGKIAVVTGASRGIGEASARVLDSSGAQVVLTGRTVSDLERVAADLANAPVVIPCDLSQQGAGTQLAEEILQQVQGVDVLVNNAGIADMRGLAPEHFDSETFNRIISVDLVGAFFYARECGRHMLENGSGSIVNIGSILGNGGSENGVIAYSAAKGGLRNMTMQLGTEWADRGVRVNAVSPGLL